jgi:hypothetical protein
MPEPSRPPQPECRREVTFAPGIRFAMVLDAEFNDPISQLFAAGGFYMPHLNGSKGGRLAGQLPPTFSRIACHAGRARPTRHGTAACPRLMAGAARPRASPGRRPGRPRP